MEQLSLVPTCEECGGLKKQVKASGYKKGWRWRCPACQKKFNKAWREEVDWNKIQRDRYHADEERRQRLLDHQKKWRNSESGQEWIAEYDQTPERRKANKRATQNANLKANYGITIEKYEEMLDKQDFGCAICGREMGYGKKSERLCVDHNHETGEIRELLCKPCNTGLGCFFDNVSTLEQAVLYLKKHAVGASAA